MVKTSKKTKSTKKQTKKSIKSNKEVGKESVKDTKNKGEEIKPNNNVFKIKKSVLISVLLLVVIILVLVRSQVSFQDEEEDLSTYRGYEFERHSQLDNVWLTTVKIGDGEQKREFRYHPTELEQYSYDYETSQYFHLSQLANGKVSISFYEEVLTKGSGYVSLSGYDLARVLKLFFFEEVSIFAEGLEDYEWVTCEDASIENLVIEFKQGEPRVTSNDFCVEIYFEEPEDALRLTYKLIYNLFGVME